MATKKKSTATAEKLQRIQALWAEIQQTKEHSPQYEALVEQMHVLSVEYQALVEAAKKTEK